MQATCCLTVLHFVYLQHHLYRSLGLNLSLCDPPEAQRLQILSEVISHFLQSTGDIFVE